MFSSGKFRKKYWYLVGLVVSDEGADLIAASIGGEISHEKRWISLSPAERTGSCFHLVISVSCLHSLKLTVRNGGFPIGIS